jgi:hydroxymethylbilane synthase
MHAQGSLRIGTRGSPLALLQANEVESRLLAAHPDLDSARIEIVVIRTSGDRIRDKPLRDFGGKGLFTKEIEAALHAGEIDLAVHSMKDVPTALPEGLAIACLLPREDPRDALLAAAAASLDDLAPGAVVGSSSLRRRAQLLHARPDLRLVEFRGNVETRLAKLAAGEAEATLLAMAGLNRLGMADKASAVLAPEVLLPAVAQGAIGIEIRIDDAATAARLAPLNDAPTEACITAERAFLAALDGSCKTPIAGLAVIEADGGLAFRGQILTPDGAEVHETERRGSLGEARELGLDAGRELAARAGPGFFETLD